MPDTDNLRALLSRLKSAQRDLLISVAGTGNMPSQSDFRKISDYEAAIAAIEAVLIEEQA